VTSLAIAQTTREALENFVLSPTCPHIKAKGTKSLLGMCAQASVFLAQTLEAAGHKATVVQGFFGNPYRRVINHTWVECEGQIFDITATQYSSRGKYFPEVHTVHCPHTDYEAVVNSQPSDLSAFQNWPEDQKPTKELLASFPQLRH
jgi:hypothetical protein